MKDIKILQYAVLLTQIGLNIALPIMGGVYTGAYLDRRFSTGSAFLILGVILGLLSGVAGVYRLVSIEFKKKK
ncbi:AtpZ/AtpI family protein [Thermosediminibacter oceani]|uniref:AtpZ/AtpI family protein n=1 Tax=Thermosediminibacter oceani TaxID=291990 RepID=UPI0003162EF4|nr:AtpZ/AtpI family protein [Thermosediminibacter oceani]